MSTANNHFKYHQELVRALYQYCLQQLPFSSNEANDVDRNFINSLKQLTEFTHLSDDYIFLGQTLLGKIIAHYPHITEAINRDLLWYFGGDCLHFLSDEEINQYQQVEELLHETQGDDQPLDYTQARARIFKLH